MKITIEANINSNLDTTWNSWTKPEHITKWNFADESWHCPSATNDLKVGGKYSARMEAKDGSFGFDFVATYDQIENQSKIVYTMEDGRQVETLFIAGENGVHVTSIFDAEEQNPVEMQKQGWQSILNNFKKYTETL